MTNEVEDLEAHRRKVAAEEARRQDENDGREWRDLAERMAEHNKDLFARQAFANAVVDILRDVNRQQPGTGSISELARFFDMLKRGAKVTLGELTEAAVERIRPDLDAGKHTDRERALISVALAGLAYLVESGAEDGFGSARLSKRDGKLVAAIDRFNDEWGLRRRMAEASSYGQSAGYRAGLVTKSRSEQQGAEAGRTKSKIKVPPAGHK